LSLRETTLGSRLRGDDDTAEAQTKTIGSRSLIKVLFVCMGNICRSPTAEAVFHQMLEQFGLYSQIHVDSAGTNDYHSGDAPDPRAIQAGLRRGYDMTRLRARQVTLQDFLEFDFILAMDNKNLADLKRLYPANGKAEIGLFMDYSEKFAVREVPDPYYGGVPGFERVLDQVEDAAHGLLKEMIARARKAINA
jgi:protein-tyrosine phosphatase